MTKDNKTTYLRSSFSAWFVYIALSVFIVGWVMFSAKQESATFNRLTGSNTTMWDALWVELRVTK